MSRHLEVSPQVEARFTAITRQQGLDLATLFETMVTDYQSNTKKNPAVQQPKFTAENDPLMAGLKARIAAAPTDPDVIREADEDMQELMRNLYANRWATGERIPFPEAR